MLARVLRRTILAACAACALTGPASADAVLERNLSIDSPALGATLRFNVYKPAVAPPDGRRWPALYLLEGRPSESDWLDQGGLAELMDRAIAEGVIPPTMVVMPVAPYSWYVDNPDPGGQGLVKTAVARDLVAAVEAQFPVAACREARAVGGLSMGGYGALVMALSEPDRFAAAVSLSGSVAPPIDARDPERLKRADAFYDGAFGRPLDRARFNAWSPFTLLRRLPADGPRPDVFLSVGDRDRGGLLKSTTRLHVDLIRAGVDSAFRIGPGVHDWDFWRRELPVALAWLGPKLDPTCGDEVAASGRRAGG